MEAESINEKVILSQGESAGVLYINAAAEPDAPEETALQIA